MTTEMVAVRAAPKACDRTCKWWSFDMDGAFCCHPTSFQIAPTFGASTNRMSLEGHCRGGYDDPALNDRALWEPRT